MFRRSSTGGGGDSTLLASYGTASRVGAVLVRKRTPSTPLASDWKKKTLALFAGDPAVVLRAASGAAAAGSGGAAAPGTPPSALLVLANPDTDEVCEDQQGLVRAV